MGLFIVIAIVLGIFALGAAPLFGRPSRNRMDSIQRAPQILKDLFDGKEMVSYQVTRATLPYALIVEEAPNYGYKLAGQDKQGRVTTVVFERVS